MYNFKNAGWVVLCVAAPVLAFAAVHPVLEMGMNDDYLYVRMARVFADTGHFAYDNFTSAMTVPHVLWGALIIRVFGFSFLALRLSVLPLWAGCGILMYLLAGRLGLPPACRALASLCFTFSPIAVQPGTSFMTDIPAMLLLLLAAYCVMRAIAAIRVSGAARWLAGAAIAGLVAGAIREILWAAPICMIPAAVFLRWRERRLRMVGILLAALVIAGAILGAQWRYAQPYAVRQAIEWPTGLIGAFPELVGLGVNLLLTTLLMCLPALVCLGLRALELRGWARATACALLVPGAFAAWRVPRLAMPPWIGNLVTVWGSFGPNQVLIGDEPVVLQPIVRLSIGLAVLIGSAVWVGAALQVAGQFRRRLRTAIAEREQLLAFVAITGPFVLAYLGLLTYRGNRYPTFDRYLLPIVSIVILYTLCLAFRLKPAQPNPACWVALAALAVYGVADAHDLYADNRAKLAAATWLEELGTKRHCVTAGYEYDGWTQLEEKGLMSRTNAASYPVSAWYFGVTDALAPCYYVVSSPQSKLGSVVRTIAYPVWLPPGTRTLLIQHVAGECPAGCRRY